MTPERILFATKALGEAANLSPVGCLFLDCVDFSILADWSDGPQSLSISQLTIGNVVAENCVTR